MPIVFGRAANTVDAILAVFREHGELVRGTYRARYAWNARSGDPYAGATLERPPALRENPASVVFPWEQVFLAAATCAGSDYPMLAAHRGVPLAKVELVVEGVFDPRPEFHGLAGFETREAHAYASLHLRATLESTAPRDALEALHTRVISKNMVLDALRGIPRTDELVVL